MLWAAVRAAWRRSSPAGDKPKGKNAEDCTARPVARSTNRTTSKGSLGQQHALLCRGTPRHKRPAAGWGPPPPGPPNPPPSARESVQRDDGLRQGCKLWRAVLVWIRHAEQHRYLAGVYAGRQGNHQYAAASTPHRNPNRARLAASRREASGASRPAPGSAPGQTPPEGTPRCPFAAVRVGMVGRGGAKNGWGGSDTKTSHTSAAAPQQQAKEVRQPYRTWYRWLWKTEWMKRGQGACPY